MIARSNGIGRIGPIGLMLLLVSASLSFPVESSPAYDLVILNGRVIDPESKSDAIRNLGISNGAIKAITSKKLDGRTVIDARGLTVSPGAESYLFFCCATRANMFMLRFQTQ